MQKHNFISKRQPLQLALALVLVPLTPAPLSAVTQQATAGEAQSTPSVAEFLDGTRVDPDEMDARRGGVEDRRGELEANRGGGELAARTQQAAGARERNDLYSNLDRDRSARISGNNRANTWNSRSRGSTATRRRSAGGGRRRR